MTRKYAQNFQAACKPSRLRKILVFVWSLAVFWIVNKYFQSQNEWRWILLGLVVLSFWYGFQENQPFIQTIRIEPDENARKTQSIILLDLVNLNNQKQTIQTIQVRLCSGSLISPYICFFKWKQVDNLQNNSQTTSKNRIYWQCILPDSMDSDEFRRLRVWARWCSKTYLKQKIE